VMRVSHVEDDFPEAHLRKSKWFSVSEAIERVREPDLQSLLQRYILDPC
jgi:hypothetical protein